MSDPTTSNILLSIPVRGSNVGVWDVPVNSDFTALDGYLGGVVTVAVASSPVTLTSPSGTPAPSAGPTQAQNAVLRFTGALGSNVTVTLPLPGSMIVENLTTGNFLLQFRGVSVSEVISIAPGSCRRIYNDGINVRFVDLPEVGTYWDIASGIVPLWLAGCTKPPFLLCDGSTFSAITYPYLNTFLGGNTLPDFRGRNTFFLNGSTSRLTSAGAGLDGNTLFAAENNNGVTLSANQLPTHSSVNASQNIVVTGPNGHTMPLDAIINGQPYASAPGNPPPWSGGAPTSSAQFSGANSISVTYTNNSQAVVPLAAPGIVGGIRLIRAG